MMFLVSLAALALVTAVQPVLRAPAEFTARYEVEARLTSGEGAEAGGDVAWTLEQRARVLLAEGKRDAEGAAMVTGRFESLAATLNDNGRETDFAWSAGAVAPEGEPEACAAMRRAAVAGFKLQRIGSELSDEMEGGPGQRRMRGEPERVKWLGVFAASALPRTLGPIVALDVSEKVRAVGAEWVIERRLGGAAVLRLRPRVVSVEGERVVVRGPVEIEVEAAVAGSAEPEVTVVVRDGEFSAEWAGERLVSSELRYEAVWTARLATERPIERKTTTTTRIKLRLVP
ncbi:MAG: hypothetical protein ACKVW3_17160 [Phycisphaerales bacterium]